MNIPASSGPHLTGWRWAFFRANWSHNYASQNVRSLSERKEFAWQAWAAWQPIQNISTRDWVRRCLPLPKRFMRDTIQVPFGLLICAEETRPFYPRSRWQAAADALYFTQEQTRRMLKTCVMIVPLTDQLWPAGEIDLCGLPW